MAMNPQQPQNKPKPTIGVAQPQAQQQAQPQPAQPKVQQPKPIQAAKSGSFQSIKQYQQANVPGTQKLAGNISGNIQGKAGQAQQAIGQAQQQTQGQIQQGVAQGQQALSQAGQAVGGYAGLTPEQLEQQLQGGLAVGQQAQQLGQTGLQGAQDLYGQATQLGELGQATGSIEGRQEILKDLLRKKYSQGASQMDALLLGGNREAQAKLQAARNVTRGLGQEVGVAEGAVSESAKQAQEQLEGGVGSLKGQLSDTGMAGEVELTAAAEEANKAAEAASQAQMSDFERRGLLEQSGYKVHAGRIKLPNGIEVKIRDLPDEFFKREVVGKADTGNIDPAKLARLNVIRKLGGQAEIAGTGEQFKQKLQNKLEGQNLEKEVGRIQSELASANVANASRVAGLNVGTDKANLDIMNDVAKSNDHYAKLAARLDPKGISAAMKFSTPEQRKGLASFVQTVNPAIAKKIQDGTVTPDELKLMQMNPKLKDKIPVLMKSLGSQAISNARQQSDALKKEAIVGTFKKKKK